MSCSHRSALCSPAGGSLYLSVLVWTDPSGCINGRFVQVNSWVPIISSKSISSLEDRAITNTPAKSEVVVLLTCQATAIADEGKTCSWDSYSTHSMQLWVH